MSNNPESTTILILFANPASTPRLRLDEEVRKIDEVFRRSNNRERFMLEIKCAVRARDLFQAILDYQPQIVHVSGHCAGEDGILLEDDWGQPTVLNTDALIEAFSTKGVECVVLNACFSQAQADAISQCVNYAIGINREIGDKVAIDFATGFYEVFADLQDVESAFELACSRLINDGEHLTPVLKKRMLQ
ncbi:CHAT domain-containing protein [Tolypothrix bouteillei VB521301_2]|uniref:CHAT domain-containing protein n=1 Tax=Tolypothrix bouteillei VB521301 TaxID=1479485 RepID=A0A0C1RPV1_9CYAN